MRVMKNYMAGTVLSAALLFSSVAKAMSVPQYDKMTNNDQNNYASLLVVGAKNALVAHGETPQAEKLVALFSDKSPNSGAAQFWKNLQAIRVMNAKNAADPNNKQVPYEVEDAFYLTLKENGIIVPISVLLTINKDFKPSGKP